MRSLRPQTLSKMDPSILPNLNHLDYKKYAFLVKTGSNET